MGDDRRRRVGDVDQPSVLVFARPVNVLGAPGPLASANGSPVGSRRMTASYPRDPVIAVAREGEGGRRRSSDHDDSVATDQQYAHNLGQTVLRSEFVSHFLPPTGPTPS